MGPHKAYDADHLTPSHPRQGGASPSYPKPFTCAQNILIDKNLYAQAPFVACRLSRMQHHESGRVEPLKDRPKLPGRRH